MSFATMMEYKPALDILAPRASIYLGGLDGEHILGRVGGANPSYTATICSAKLESLSNPPKQIVALGANISRCSLYSPVKGREISSGNGCLS